MLSVGGTVQDNHFSGLLVLWEERVVFRIINYLCNSLEEGNYAVQDNQLWEQGDDWEK